MKRYFNTEGQCDPKMHYMVHLDERLDKIKQQYVDREKYFVINRGRQYGKTTTLMALAQYLKSDYMVISMDFQMMSSDNFENEKSFVCAFVHYFTEVAVKEQRETADEDLWELMEPQSTVYDNLNTMFGFFSRVCERSTKPVVLIIDEVDNASNYQVFLDFLALLRGYYLDRKNKPTFWSVILAGVYDIKNLKMKMRPENEHQYGSPWNIAASFDIDMTFSVKQIEEMLCVYEAERHTGMDALLVAQCIYEYTSGYPYLVSAICKLMDETICESETFEDASAIWTREGVAEAVKLLLYEQLPLFQSMMHQLSDHPDLKRMLHAILFQGKRVTFNPDHPVIQLAAMFGYIVNKERCVQVANRIFEMRLYNFFLSEEELTNAMYDDAQGNRSWFLDRNRLDMKRILERFVVHFTDIYGKRDEKFVEEYGRKFFLLYLKPIINGTGNYYIEAQTRDARRTDVIVDYLGEQFIVELKIWRGNEYDERGKEQLAQYLDDYHQKKGYLLSFNFNKKKVPGVKEFQIDDKTIIEAMI